MNSKKISEVSTSYMLYDWHLYFKTFKSLRPLQFIFQVFDIQGDGFVMLTIGLLYRSFQIKMPFPGDKIKFRCDWRLFR